MRIKIEKSIAKGVVNAPPSKSEAHRFLIAAALSEGKSVIRGVSGSEDMKATIDAVKSIGAEVLLDGTTATVIPNSRKGDGIVNCRESGSTLRFFMPVLLARLGGGEFECSERLVERGVNVYEECLAKDGITIKKSKTEIIVGGALKGGKYVVRGDVSSQYISGLLFALPTLSEDSEIEVTGSFESKDYVDMTVEILSAFGVKIERENNCFFVKGNQRYSGGEYTVGGDWSNSAFLLALDCLGGDVTVNGLDENSTQGDKVVREIFTTLDGENPVVDLANCPDLAPVLFVVAGLKNGAKFTSTRRLKIKESDRGAVMAEELAKFGIKVDLYENDVYVHKSTPKTPCSVIYGHNDHRIVMALSVLATVTGGAIDGVGAVDKSYPNFFSDLKSLGVKYEI